MLRQLREGNLDASQYAEKDEMLYHKQANTDGTTNLEWLRSSGGLQHGLCLVSSRTS
ncbi:unnamed protein product [Acanthoscelides obtectus]|uniref:Uncharacterized protein n=1 Tax=Acanthoscelides obtectus TaxID=200917 RepID=A0A9P0L0H3_ACAOB|nr:unnamed protein product [Acanthoscelides obtectus]CAK1624042.1 hypothetical protein AOBTE_LOCUS2301 [Acanthoscelides obtectus]